MPHVVVHREIDAPAETVFKAVADIEHLPDTSPDILKIEFLTERRVGVGTRFRETRQAGSQQMETDLEVTEYTENRRVRMVADSHGTIWDSVFVLEPAGAATRLSIEMEARGHTWRSRLMNLVMRPFFRKGIAKHLDQVKAYCEA